MPKRDLKMTFSLFLLAILAILLPFGVIISISIGVKTGIISKNSSLYDICTSFIGIFSKKRSNNTDLDENVVFRQCIKPLQLPTLPQQLQQLTPPLPSFLCQIYSQLTTCILLIKLAPNMQYKNALIWTSKIKAMFLT